MSGGSYDWLFTKSLKELINNENLKEMRNKLIELGYYDAADETKAIQEIIKQAAEKVQSIRERLDPVWKAVEWVENGDWVKDDLKKTIEQYRIKLGLNAARAKRYDNIG